MFRRAAVESMTLAVELFNRPSPVGRDHAVVMMTAHAFEMLLKAIIYQNRRTVADPSTGLSYTLQKCLDIAADDLGVLRDEERVLLRSLKQDRDAATHDIIEMSDELLWVHMRSGVTIFQRLLRDELQDEGSSSALPARVLPVSAVPPTDMTMLVQEEVDNVKGLLAPGKRRTAEAAARLRPLLALDGSVTGRVDAPTDKEVARAGRALADGADWQVVLPGLATLKLRNRPKPEADEIVLQVGRAKDAVPVRRAAPDEEAGALAYRSTNPFDEYGVKLSTFGERLGLTQYQGYALIDHLKLKEDDKAFFQKLNASGNPIFQGLSARAAHLGRTALDNGLDLETVVATYTSAKRPRRR